jgi:hypothetical protein
MESGMFENDPTPNTLSLLSAIVVVWKEGYRKGRQRPRVCHNAVPSQYPGLPFARERGTLRGKGQ